MILVTLTIFSRRIHFVLTSGSGTAISWVDQTLIPKKRSWAHQPAAVQNSLGFFFQHLLTQEHDKLTSLSTFKFERSFLVKCSSSQMQVPGVSPNWWEESVTLPLLSSRACQHFAPLPATHGTRAAGSIHQVPNWLSFRQRGGVYPPQLRKLHAGSAASLRGK